MTKKELIKFLKENNVNFNRIRFYKKSPYQLKRYKPEYVGWESWIYKDKTSKGFLLNEEHFESKRFLKNYIKSM